MGKKQPISEFPDDIDRRDFGNYLSGLTDGEGCFILPYGHSYNRHHRHGSARFTINLRNDDIGILYLIQSYWQCGFVKPQLLVNERNPNPKVFFNVHDISSLMSVVLPHFDKFPLRAKKSRDFKIWREAVIFLHQIQTRPWSRVRRPDSRGFFPKWSSAEFKKFEEYRNALMDQRSYNSPTLETPVPYGPEPPPRDLFSGLPPA